MKYRHNHKIPNVNTKKKKKEKREVWYTYKRGVTRKEFPWIDKSILQSEMNAIR